MNFIGYPRLLSKYFLIWILSFEAIQCSAQDVVFSCCKCFPSHYVTAYMILQLLVTFQPFVLSSHGYVCISVLLNCLLVGS